MMEYTIKIRIYPFSILSTEIEWIEVCYDPSNPPEIIDLLEPLPTKMPHVVSLFIYLIIISHLQNPKPNLFFLSVSLIAMADVNSVP